MVNQAKLQFLQAIGIDSTEADIEHKVIIPLLHVLGYQNKDWRAQAVVGQSKIDFLVHPSELEKICFPYLIIEVKAPSKQLNHNCWQIHNYMRQARATLGLLTNGYRFRLLCRSQDQIVTIAEYTQADLLTKFNLFHRLLCKTTSLKFGNAIVQSQHRLNFKFLTLIAEAFHSEELVNLLEKQQNLCSIQTKTTSTTEEKEKQGMIITVFNNKGGVGKTTLTINLAAALNSLGRRVLLIDIDPQANLTTGLGVDPLKDVEYEKRKDISDVLTDPRLDLEQVILKRRWGNVQLDIVPSHIRLSDMEATLIMTPDIDRVLKKKLKKYTAEYDYIFIDPPPSFGKVNTIALMASSGVLVPTQLAPYPIRALEYVVNRAIAIDQSRDGEPLPILGVAVSMYNRTAHKLARNMVDEIANVLAKKDESKNVELFPEKTWIPSLSMISVASGKGYPVCFAEYDNELDKRDKEAAQDALNCYINLAKHLVQKTGV